MTIKFRDPIAYRAPATQVDTDPLYPVGTVAEAYDSTYGELTLIYLQANSAVAEALGNGVTYGGDYVGTLGAPNAIGSIAISLAAKDAATPGLYGWYVIKGNVPTTVAALFADNANLYFTATAGVFDDAVVAGDYIYKAKSISAVGTPSAGLAVVFVNGSFSTDGLA